MKLRNKKTGEMMEIIQLYVTCNCGEDCDYHTREYHSIAELTAEWEDVKEPIIKDEKIRKAVRAWAEAAGATSIVVFDCNNAPCLKIDEMEFAENGGRVSISFKTSEKIDTSKAYTVAELCGEEKTCEN